MLSLTILLLFLLTVILLAKFGNNIIQKVAEKWRFIKMINQLPGPSMLEMLGVILRFKLNREKFAEQMVELFHRYAFQNEHGMVCLWFGFRPMLFLTRTQSAKAVFEDTAQNYKSDDYEIFKRLVGEGMLAASGQIWFKARRMLTPVFHFNMLESYVEIFNEQTKILMENLEEYCDTNETFDLVPYLRRYGMDVISEAVMGVTIDAQNDRNKDQYYESLRSALFYMWARIRYPWFWIAPIRWLYGYDRKLNYHCNICKKLTAEIIAEKKKEWEACEHHPSFEERSVSGKKRLAFLDLLFSVRDQYNLTDEDIRAQVDMFMAAGSDATSSQIGFTLFHLGHRQHYQDKVYEEIKRVLGESERDITSEDVHNLKYLNQCISETGRYTPNAVLIGRKITNDINICGYTIPAGISCAISLFAIMRDPKHYDNPDEYNPEHFSPEKVSERDPFGYVPFSAGIRNCIGIRFAMLEMAITLAHLLRRYRVISMLPESENPLIAEFSLKPSKGFPVRLERR